MATYPPEAFIQTITTDDILNSVSHLKKASERTMAMYRKEVMSTLVDGRYSGLFQSYLFSNILVQLSLSSMFML